MRKQFPVKPLPILEFDGANRYRIVTQGNVGECSASDWTPVTEPIKFGTLYAGGSNSPFEEPLFTIRAVLHQVLAQ